MPITLARSLARSGKIWIQSDSFLPLTLLGNQVNIFSEDPKSPGDYREIRGATVEALGAIHFADPSAREGKSGIKREQLFLETGVSGKDKGKQVEALGIRAGDPIILDRPIAPSVFPDSFSGAYLDNGLGCFAAAEVAALLAPAPLSNVRVQFAFAAFEEIGRFGSRVLVNELKPDVRSSARPAALIASFRSPPPPPLRCSSRWTSTTITPTRPTWEASGCRPWRWARGSLSRPGPLPPRT